MPLPQFYRKNLPVIVLPYGIFREDSILKKPLERASRGKNTVF
tara:strand:+ start:1619 stop:1747 length:129 start_codon:yes stop_codon:yes gene_type:complete